MTVEKGEKPPQKLKLKIVGRQNSSSAMKESEGGMSALQPRSAARSGLKLTLKAKNIRPVK